MFKSAKYLFSTGLTKYIQGPSRLCNSSLINGEKYSCVASTVKKFAIQKTINFMTKHRDVRGNTNLVSNNEPCAKIDDIAQSIKYETESDKKVIEDASPPLAINGFGRIGKCVLLMSLVKNVNVVAINDPYVKIEDIAHSLNQEKKMYGIEANISVMSDNSNLAIDSQIVRVYTEEDPEKIKWKELQVEYVIESSGKFTEVETAKKHLVAGARKVIICGPSKDAPMFVRGVNFDKYKKDMTVVWTTSSTTDCVAPLLNIINREYRVQHCRLTHLYTATVSKFWYTIDNKVHKITGENKEVGTVIPELKGKVTYDSTIVPIPYLDHAKMNLLCACFGSFFRMFVPEEFHLSMLRLNITVKKRVELEQLFSVQNSGKVPTEIYQVN